MREMLDPNQGEEKLRNSRSCQQLDLLLPCGRTKKSKYSGHLVAEIARTVHKDKRSELPAYVGHRASNRYLTQSAAE